MVDKVTVPVSEIELIDKVNELIDDKQDTLVSGTNIKTINGIDILGSGNITISGGGTISTPTWGNIAGTLSDQTDLKNALDAKYNASNPDGYQANVIETIKVNGTVQTVTTKTVDISIPAAPTVDQTYNASSTNAQSGTAVAQALTTKVSKTGDTMTGTLTISDTDNSISLSAQSLEMYGTQNGTDHSFRIIGEDDGAIYWDVTQDDGNTILADFQCDKTGFGMSLMDSNEDTAHISWSTRDIHALSIPTPTQSYTAIADSTAINAKWLKDNAMPLKQDVLVSGTNIKTINGNSLLGNGDITIQGGGTVAATWGSITGTLSAQTDLQNALNTKLDASVLEAYTSSEVETLWGSL